MEFNKKSFTKQKKGIISGALALVLTMLFTAQVFAYPLTDAVSINGVTQEKTNWCWAACSQSILSYFGTSVTQTAFVNYVKNSTTAPNLTATDAEAKSGLSHWGVSSTQTTSYLSFSTIISEIYNNNRPIYAGWSWTAGGGHALVLDGYDDDTTDYVEYMNPGDGGFHQATYTWFKGGSSYDHVWDGTLYKMSN